MILQKSKKKHTFSRSLKTKSRKSAGKQGYLNMTEIERIGELFLQEIKEGTDADEFPVWRMWR